MSADKIDHSVHALAQVAQQYTGSVRLLSTIKALADRAQDIEDALIAVRDLVDIDEATGVNLDIIGDIVGVTRYIPQSFILPFFGFDDTPNGQTFGEKENPAIGARYYEDDEPITATSVLADPEYRLLIRAKIVKNHTIATPDDIITGLSYMFEGVANVVEDKGNMHIEIGIGRPVTFIEQVILKSLDLLPRPSGVLITYISAFDSSAVFGFDDQPLAKGFDDAPDGGGIYAEEFN